MELLIDTHVIVWVAKGDERLSAIARDSILDPANALMVSAVTAWEFADLQARGRLPQVPDLSVIAEQLAVSIIELPAAIWLRAATLPHIHGDPVDRMIIAHAIHADLTLVTADKKIRKYAVRTLW